MNRNLQRYDAARGTVLLGTQQIIAYASYFAFAIALTRILSPAAIGEVSLLAAVLAIFGGLTQLGLPPTAVQFISSSLGKGNESEVGAIARSTLRMMLVSAGLGGTIAVGISVGIGNTIFGPQNGTSLLLATFGSGFLLDLTTLYNGYFLGAGLYTKAVYQNVLYIPLSRGLGILLAFLGLGVLGIVLGWFVGGILALFLSIYLWRGHFQSRMIFPPKLILAFGIPIFVSSLVILLQGWSDIAILQVFTGKFETTGAYYLVVTGVGFLSILWTPLVSALYPVLSLSHASDGAGAVVDRLNEAIRLSNLTVLPLGASIAAIAPTVLSAVFGRTYSQQALSLLILSLVAVFSAQGALLLATLQAIKRPRSVLGVTVTAFVTDTIILVLTANSLGSTGAAIGRAALAVITVILSYLMLRSALRPSLGNGLGKAIPLALASSLPLFAIDQILLPLEPLLKLPLLLAVFTIAFCLASRTLEAFTLADYEMVAGALPHRFQKYLGLLKTLLIR